MTFCEIMISCWRFSFSVCVTQGQLYNSSSMEWSESLLYTYWLERFQNKDGWRYRFHSTLLIYNSESFFTLQSAHPRSTTTGRALQFIRILQLRYQNIMRSIAFPSSDHRWQGWELAWKLKKYNLPFSISSLAMPAERLRVRKMICWLQPSNPGHASKMVPLYKKCPKVNDQIDTCTARTSYEVCAHLSTKTSRGSCACGTLEPNSQPL